jgi:hypothetical protein
VLARGGVIGGSSAGATIQGDYLVRGAIAGPQIMMTPEKAHERGFKFLRRSAIDQHINTRLYQPWEKPYFVLSAGDVYNMKTRKIEKLGTGAEARK